MLVLTVSNSSPLSPSSTCQDLTRSALQKLLFFRSPDPYVSKSKAPSSSSSYSTHHGIRYFLCFCPWTALFIWLQGDELSWVSSYFLNVHSQSLFTGSSSARLYNLQGSARPMAQSLDLSSFLPPQVVSVLPQEKCPANWQRRVFPFLSDCCCLGKNCPARDYISKFSHLIMTTGLFLASGIRVEVICTPQKFPMDINSFSSPPVEWWYQLAELN